MKALLNTHLSSADNLQRIFGFSLVFTMIFAGCTSRINGVKEVTTKINVVTTTSIVGDITANIGKDIINLYVLMPPGTSPHAYEPTPQDLSMIYKADIIFANGAGLETFLEDVIENKSPSTELVLLSDELDLISIHPDDVDGHDQETGDSVDPHVWFDPINILDWVSAITDKLIENDPENTAVYSENGEAYEDKLIELDKWISDQVNSIPSEDRLLVTDHQVLNYFARRYNFDHTNALISAFSDQAETSGKALAELHDWFEENNAKAIFLSADQSDDFGCNIAADLGVKCEQLYTGSLSLENEPANSYINLIRYNVNIIVATLTE